MSDLVVDIIDLPHQVGATKDLHLRATAPAGLGTEVIGVPEGAPLELDVSLVTVEDGVLARAWGQVAVHGQCVRCLRDIDQTVSLSLDELYLTEAAAQRQKAAGDEEAEELFVLGERSLDLEPAVRDALVLDLPFQPLCQPDCRGLCADCGERLDDLPADHAHERTDPRWSALAALLDDGQEA